MSATEIPDSGNVTNTIGAFEPRQRQSLRIAYFVNHYPKVSHTFIRREILALERQGIRVDRIALRGWDDALPDPQDERERERTHYILKGGFLGLLVPTLVTLLGAPLRFWAALRTAVSLSRESER